MDTTAATEIVDQFCRAGYPNFTGVPCSLLAGVFAYLEHGTGPAERYLPAPREDTAVGVATGMTLADRGAVTLMQNSGLGYCLNVLTSLNLIYGLHLPLVVSWRGRHDDAVEHDVIGARLEALAGVFGLAWTLLDVDDPARSVERCLDPVRSGSATSLLVVGEAV